MMEENIRKIGIDNFIKMVLETGTRCLKEKKEDIMGEARERMKLGLAPRVMQPGQQIQLGPEVMKHAIPKACKCGCSYFIPAVRVSTISALISPIGQELTTQQPVLICLKCQEPLNLKTEDLKPAEG
jgi:hypothetical protein